MSFITNSLIRPLAQWYSEINSATLTGAIDVLVIEQADGSFVSSPFHVRFGKLGVLKAKEKVVDIEINDEPVEIHMKLDDHGTAFFVEEMSEVEEDDFPPELATSPIPDEAMQLPNFDLPSSVQQPVNRSLVEAFNSVCDESKPEGSSQKSEAESKEVSSLDGSTVNNAKLKLNRKKRKRRQFHHRHSRNGSKTSLKEMLNDDRPLELNSSESGDGTPMASNDKAEDVFDLEDNDNDGDLDDDENDTPVNSLRMISSTPNVALSERNQKLLVHQPSFTSLKSEEQSFLQSRLGDEAIESILETQEKLVQSEDLQGTSLQAAAERQEANYFSEPDLTSPSGSPRSSSPVLSDTEYETKRQSSEERENEQSWEWGKLPTTTGSVQNVNVGGSSSNNNNANIESVKSEAELKESAEKQRQRRWTLSSFWSSSQASSGSKVSAAATAAEQQQRKRKEASGVYLDDLKDDEEMMALYVGSSRHDHGIHEGLSTAAVDDDAESGKGQSLPMSPHSVEGAIGGVRIRYDSSDEDRHHLGNKLLPDMALSLCGGLGETDIQPFSTLMFEQSLISFDDFVMKLKNGEDVFSNPNLVIRIGVQYYTWKAACPIVLSTMLYGRTLPSDLVKVIMGSYQETPASAANSKQSSPNSKVTRAATTSTSWWPFGSRREDLNDLEGKKTNELSEVLQSPTSLQVAASTVIEVNKISPVSVANSEMNKTVEERRGSSSEGEISDPDLGPLKVVQQDKRFKKTLRLTTDAIKQLNLKPGSNEAQFSVTTAYQGTSRCKCHIYWWKSTDKIVISDIDGTITKSDVLGHVLPIIGRDWAQSGVASLFSKIANNGYHIAYLSARAIGQASITKDYLSSIRQGDMNLPDGPLFLNPTSLVNAFHREVIEKKPEKFKIACLRDIQKLFPEDSNPFYAGYGNRVNDVFAYRTVGIPISRIFTINSKGELRHELTQTFLTSYGCQSSIVDHIFPPTSPELENPSSQQEYSSFTFWREPILQLDLEDQDHP